MGSKYYCSRVHFQLNYAIGAARSIPADPQAQLSCFNLADFKFMLFDENMQAYSFDKFRSKDIPYNRSKLTWMQFLSE
jgi:hypothetical protein